MYEITAGAVRILGQAHRPGDDVHNTRVPVEQQDEDHGLHEPLCVRDKTRERIREQAGVDIRFDDEGIFGVGR